MTSSPLVSVIIPCYNQARYLPEAIDSVLAQTYPDVELIVVNDGSPDDTEAVAGRYGDRIRYVARPNGGISAARNSGIAVARGDYMKFLDSDDYLHPAQIARQVEAVAGRDDVVSFTACRLFRDGQPEEYQDHLPQAKALLPELFTGMDWGSILCYLFPSKLVHAVGGFAEGVHHAEDWYFAVRVGMHDPHLKLDSRIGCYYRQRAGSASANRPAWARSQARLTMQLHDQLRALDRRDWFGPVLLDFEQSLYEGMVRQDIKDKDLLTGMLQRIMDLQAHVGPGKNGWRFRLLAGLLGYGVAERVRAFLVRLLRIRPPETLDTAGWRQHP
jgi:glycosyltransferase involved in cell wall biosynthesis